MVRLIIGCGYLGRRVAALWLAQGDSVYALTRSPTHASELEAQGVQPLVGDVMDPESLRTLPAADTLLYAVGFDRHGSHSRSDVVLTGLGHVLQALPTSLKQLLFVSSTSVYGQSSGEGVDEDTPCHPVTEGGRLYRDAELLTSRELSQSGTRPDVDLRICRAAGLYGPDRLIGRIAALRAGEPLAVNPNGWLNLIHIDDCAAAITAVAERGRAGRTYLLSDGNPVLRRDFYSQLAELVGAPLPSYAAAAGHIADLGKRCRNARLLQEANVRLRFPDTHTGLPDALARSTKISTD